MGQADGPQRARSQATLAAGYKRTRIRAGGDYERFKAKALVFLKAHESDTVIRKLRWNEPLTRADLGRRQDVTDTYWYVTGTPELMEAVGQLLNRRWEGV